MLLHRFYNFPLSLSSSRLPPTCHSTNILSRPGQARPVSNSIYKALLEHLENFLYCSTNHKGNSTALLRNHFNVQQKIDKAQPKRLILKIATCLLQRFYSHDGVHWNFKAQIPLGSTRLDSTRSILSSQSSQSSKSRRACRARRAVLFQHGGRRTILYKFSRFYALAYTNPICFIK